MKEVKKMIAPEKFFEKLKDSGLSPEDVSSLYWSIAYCLILKITSKSLSFSEIEKEYLTQDSLFKKINLETIPANERDIIEGVYANEENIRQKVRTEKMAPHEAILNNRISHYKLLLRFTKEDEKEAEGIRHLVEEARSRPAAPESEKGLQQSKEIAGEPAPNEPGTPPKKRKGLLTIATLTTLGVTGAFIVNRFVKKNKKGEDKK